MQDSNLPDSGGTQHDGPRTVALAADLLFAGRIRGTAGAAGRSVTLARRPQDVVDAVKAGAVRVLLDLDARSVDVPALIRALREDVTTRHAEIIAWVSHVRTDRPLCASCPNCSTEPAGTTRNQRGAIGTGRWRPVYFLRSLLVNQAASASSLSLQSMQ